jgi:ring-1,2-phenylacetyl-CoA epoxidase subunit PaaD
VVSAAASLEARAWRIAADVADPELPMLSIADLGILRAIRVAEGAVSVLITPTYSGCPAMGAIADDIAAAFAAAGIAPVRVEHVLAPAWSSDWITPAGRRKLAAAGIAPPTPGNAPIPCPRCASLQTEILSFFGITACRALWRCLACGEPFDRFKCH